jgi:L-alanine-DL-glutamate epimerase-like enolase superfamily enzyme
LEIFFVTRQTPAIRIRDVNFSFADHRYRTPIKFGGVALDRVTLLDAQVVVELPNGKTQLGFGSMPLGNVWAFPSRKLGYEDTLGAMKHLTTRIAKLYADCSLSGHPIDLTRTLEPEFHTLAAECSQQLNLADPLPALATLVVASPFDAALHDAFGKIHSLSCWQTYGRDFLPQDLGHYLGGEFAGQWLEDHVSREPIASLPLYHLVGALDPLEEQDVGTAIGDGLPETLGEWIEYNGLTHLKIKLNGDDVGWDVERVTRVNRVCETMQARRGRDQDGWQFSLDFNERCRDVGVLLDFLHRLKESAPRAFDRVAYIEQPTARDLKANRHNVMHEAAKLRPIVIDESLLDLDSLQLAREMGYTGAALKACKGQSQSLLLAAAARRYGMFLCVQDLTCPGASLIHSASLAAHIPGMTAIEANSRQYCPGANVEWQSRFPGIFAVKNGRMDTSVLNGPGLGAYS